MLLKDIQITGIGGNNKIVIDMKKYGNFIKQQVESVCNIQKNIENIAKLVKANVLNKDVWYDDMARDFATKSWNNQRGNHDEGIQSLYLINKTVVGLTDVVVAKMCQKMLELDPTKATASEIKNINAFKLGSSIGVTIGGNTINKMTIKDINNIGYIDVSQYGKGEIPLCEDEEAIDSFLQKLQTEMRAIFEEVNIMANNISKYILNQDTAVISFKSEFNKTVLKQKIQYIKRQLENIDDKMYVHMSAMVQERGKTISGLKAIYETDYTNDITTSNSQSEDTSTSNSQSEDIPTSGSPSAVR